EQKLENCKVYRGKQAENIKANIISNLDEMVPQEFLKDLFWHSLENKQNDVYSYIMRDYESCMNNASLSTVIQEAQKHALMSSDKMVEANIRYVVKIVNRYIDNKLDFLELVQEGTIGITIAADRFDYTKGFKFSTYATWWIRQSITRFILDTERTVRVPVHLQEKIRQINRVRAVEYMKKGVLPEDCEVAQKLHIGADLVEDYSRSIFSTETRSFVTQTEDGQESDLDPPDPDAIMGYDIIHRNDVSRFIWAGISKLDPREQQVLCMRFGLGPCSKYGLREDATTLMTLKQVGNLYGLTRERIRQIEYFALKKLKHTYNNKPFQELY
ncbi:sigma-70 family RNA polymerase sigma factor, partial [Candidatus Woesearchaeota archaeon]|nr:sigma-70 family RNA polymerase sigma factor [Candidatus Woesearchaeota archaeon]